MAKESLLDMRPASATDSFEEQIPDSQEYSFAAFTSAALGSFGLVAAIVIPPLMLGARVEIVAWLIAPIAVGAVYRNDRGAAYVGVLISIVAFFVLGATRAKLPQGEWSSVGDTVDNVAVIAYALLAALLVGVGARLEARPSARVRGRRSKAVHAVAAAGIVAVASTLALSFLIPDSKAYAIELSPEWVVGPSRGHDPSFGTDFSASLGPPERPTFHTPPTRPVVGVSVVSLSASASPSDCFGAFNSWPGNPMLTQSQRIRAGDTSLPVGPAYEWIGTREGLTFYSYSFGRERRILFDPRQLCYMLVVTVPDASPMKEADARVIADSFRYR